MPGLVAWLTVRHHRASTDLHWRSGVFLRHPIATYSSEALLELRTATELTLTVRAPSPDLFFNVLRDSIEDLLTRRWPGLDYELMVPCPARNGSDGRACSGNFPLPGLLLVRQNGQTSTVSCLRCGKLHEIAELLTGFAQPELLIQPALEQLHHELAEVKGGVTRLENYAADAADAMRRMLRIVGTEVDDCPRLFTLTPVRAAGIGRVRFWVRHYRLVLWCEHPGHWHPWSAATYDLDEPRAWLVKVGPYASLVIRILQAVVPVAASVAGALLTADQLAQAQNEIQLMTALVAAVPDSGDGFDDAWIPEPDRDQLTRAQGAAARTVRFMLFQLDHRGEFGDMRRVAATSGEFLWVCPDHYVNYDPGLPAIQPPAHN